MGDREIKVIGAGMGRTGTKSLQAALQLLGFATYHFVEPDHSQVWANYATGEGSIESVLDCIVNSGYTATCDNPCADIYRQQLNRFPNAKVVLTVRDNGQVWAKSWRVLMRFIEVQEREFSLTYPTFIQFIPFMRNWKKMRSMMGVHLGLPPGELIRGWKSKPDEWLPEIYEAHNAHVKTNVSSSQLLVFNVKEGWGPLCKFLGVPVPDIPFPNVNESGDISFATNAMIVASYAWIPLLVTTVGGAYGVFLSLKGIRT